LGQVFGGLFEGHKDARLAKLCRAAHQKLHGQQGLATAGAAADQRRSAFGQSAPGDFIQSLDAGRRLGLRRVAYKLGHSGIDPGPRRQQHRDRHADELAQRVERDQVERHGAGDAQHKTRVEIETEVGDYDAAFSILTALGYTPVWRYEKYRESFRLEDVSVTLDHTPIGDFVEIEGPAPAIRPAAGRLGFDWTERSLKTYRELFAEASGAQQGNMTFDD